MKFENYKSWVRAIKEVRDNLFVVRYYLSAEGIARYNAYNTLLGLTDYCDTAVELMEFLGQKQLLRLDDQKNLSSHHLALPLRKLERLAKEEAAPGDSVIYQETIVNDVKIIEAAPSGLFSRKEFKVDLPNGASALVGRLFFWCNSTGDLRLPDGTPLLNRDINALPAGVVDLYQNYWVDGCGADLYTVTLNGTHGMLFVLLADDDWVEESHNIKHGVMTALRNTAAWLVMEDRLPEGCQILLMNRTDPDGSELGIFFPEAICDKVPAFTAQMSELSDAIYAKIAEG